MHQAIFHSSNTEILQIIGPEPPGFEFCILLFCLGVPDWDKLIYESNVAGHSSLIKRKLNLSPTLIAVEILFNTLLVHEARSDQASAFITRGSGTS